MPDTASTPTDLTSKLFRGFADPTRLTVLEALRNGPLCVGDVVRRTGLRQSGVSNHLACLKGCGLVACERQGRYVVYRMSDPRVAELLGLAEELLADVAHGVPACTRYDPEVAAHG
ncbi:MAG: metalloregulator ArsR/SmtB family transcription factor [Trueperaceae bacterium]